MPTHAPPAPFNPDTEEWESFMIRFRSYLVANDLERANDEKKRALLIGYCGPRTVRLAQGLVSPQTVETVSWSDLQKILKEYFQPTPSRTVLRHKFNERNQQENESINTYIAELRMAAEKCNFPDLEDRLTDRLVCGVRDPNLQQKLLAKPELNWKTAVAIARAAECAKNSSAEIKQPTNLKLHESATKMKQEASAHKLSADGEEECNVDEEVHFQKNQATPNYETLKCSGCGGTHSRASCRFKGAICRRCKKKGHLAHVCLASAPAMQLEMPKRNTGREIKFGKSQNPTTNSVRICLNRNQGAQKIKIEVKIAGKPCTMEVDTGSTLTVISWAKLKQLMPHLKKDKLRPHRSIISDYQGRRIQVLGRQMVPVTFKTFQGFLGLSIVERDLPTLLGLEWFQALGLQVKGIHRVDATTTDDDFGDLTSEFADLFADGLGKYNGKPISISLDPKVAPIRLKPRRVPFAIRPKIDEQLDKLIKQGILVPVEHALWETPIVTPVKPDGSVRICGDFKSTLNRAMQQSAYPVPVVQHLLHQLGEGKIFAKLDLAQAYQQLPVCDKTAEAQTIVTHRGAFKCTRLQFGVSVAPGLFQSLMERLLAGLPGVVPYFDDILVSARSKEELRSRLRAVFQKLQESGLRLKKDKCHIGKDQVEFLGYLIDGQGIHPTKSKTEAITNAPAPRNQGELQAFLGLLNFYSSFLPHKASVAEPLHKLLGKKTPWVWGTREQAAFNAVKQLLISNQLLVQFNPNLPISLACDASPYGVGAVLSHVFPSGREAPIAFYSRTLSPTERNYSQIDKEALALVAGIKRFHEYLYGKKFSLITDHKPLLGLLAGDKPTPPILSPRVLRWTIFLAAYDYVLVHRPGKHISHADALSRCPLPSPVDDPAPSSNVFAVEFFNPELIAAPDIAAATKRDKLLNQVTCWVGRGWPATVKQIELRPFWIRRNELSVIGGCLLWGERVVIPGCLKNKLLRLLHEGHPGIVKMKALARSYVWWPGMDKEIEEWVATCTPCQESRPNVPSAPCMEWEKPRGPWSRIHIDFAGPVQGQSFLIIVDAYSKWLEIIKMGSTTAEATIRALKRVFATHGFPDVLVSDNGPQFINNTFEVYLAEQGIRHALVAPYHAASNGQAEIFVKLAKSAIKRICDGGWQERLDEFLLVQHITPSTSTGKSPAELLMGRRLRNKLDRIHPDYCQEPLRETENKKGFKVGDTVYARNYGEGPLWVPGEITAVTGPRSYRLQIADGQIWKRHQDQVRRRVLQTGNTETNNDPEAEPDKDIRVEGEMEECSSTPEAEESIAEETGSPEFRPGATSGISGTDANTSPIELRRSTRVRTTPVHLRDYVTNYTTHYLNYGGRGVLYS